MLERMCGLGPCIPPKSTIRMALFWKEVMQTGMFGAASCSRTCIVEQFFHEMQVRGGRRGGELHLAELGSTGRLQRPPAMPMADAGTLLLAEGVMVAAMEARAMWPLATGMGMGLAVDPLACTAPNHVQLNQGDACGCSWMFDMRNGPLIRLAEHTPSLQTRVVSHSVCKRA